MAVYIISDVIPHEEEAWNTYVQLAPPTIEKYGGRLLTHGGPIRLLEGNWTPQAIILVEFPDNDAAEQWYDSPEYAEALKVRDKALH